MLVPLSWLRDFAPFDIDPVALGETFDDLGMVVEGINRVGERFDGVIVAHVLDVRAHPRADKVRIVDVDTGDGRPLQIVCGAPNVATGQRVALATIGSVLPGDFEIARRKVRGEWSNGMICSARELALGDDQAGIMVLPDDLEVGAPFAEAMGIEADVVYDLAIEGNRPDANCVVGVARDAAARLKIPFEIPTSTAPRSATAATDLASVVVEAPDLCDRFTATVITGVSIGPGDPAVARRLALAGMRSIDNVVDASNYVMLELGQPTHPYDLDRLPGRGLRVRRAAPGEKLVTLDGVERRLGDGDDCLICDAEGTPVGIAGIMGGASSEISGATTSVLLEAAHFVPMAIARTSKRIGLRSEASARFERGTDPEGIDRSIERFCSLLGTGEVAEGTLDVWDRVERPRIVVRTARTNALLGASLTDEEVRGYLAPIGFEVTAVAPGSHEVVPPSFRPDARLEVDVIEEVARHHGYSRIERTVPRSPFVGGLTLHQRLRRSLRHALTGAGVSEAFGLPLLGPDDHARAGIQVEDPVLAVDPLAREESVLRVSLLPGLLKAVAFNQSHRWPGPVRLFEVGPVFLPIDRSAPLPEEIERVGVVVEDVVAARHVLDLVIDVLDVGEWRLVAATADGLHPTRTAVLEVGGIVAGHVGGIVAGQVGGIVAGHVGEVDPDVLERHGIEGRVGWVELDLPALFPAERRDRKACDLSRFPSADVDLAFLVDEATPAGDVEASLRAGGGALLVDCRLFDVYRGTGVPEGRRSLAWRLRFNALDRTLTERELAEARRRCIDAVEAAHRATLRGS